MKVGIVGLGLIGGSLAKAYHEAGERVLAHDIDRDVLSFAVISGAVDEALTDETMAECDVILLAVRPAAAVEWLKNHAAKIDKHTVVIDCCGTKRVLPNRRAVRHYVPWRSPDGGHAVLGLQVRQGEPLRGRADGARAAAL